MRILAITNRFPRPGHPTAAIFNYRQISAMAKLHDVQVIAPIAWPDRIRDWAVPPRDSNPDCLRVERPTYWFTPRIFQSHQGEFFLHSIRRTVAKVVSDFRPEVIWAVWADPEGWASVRLGRELGVPVFVKVIGSDVLVLGRQKGRRDRIVQALCEADGVVAVSHDLAHHVCCMGASSKKVHVVAEGTNTSMFRPGDQAAARATLGLPPNGRILLFVGNLLFSKGAGLVIEACGLLRDQGAEFSCYLVGSGPEEQPLRQLAARLKLGGRVVFAGRFAQEKLPTWYQACDVVTLPSYSEGSPNVLREAMCCGRPFVATRIGGIPEISGPEFSRLVDVGDVPELAGALCQMLAAPPRVDPSVPDRYIAGWDKSAAEITELLAEAVANRSATAPKNEFTCGVDQVGSQIAHDGGA
jgi:glycosyltransferase involved in cell wall biosynthesis